LAIDGQLVGIPELVLDDADGAGTTNIRRTGRLDNNALSTVVSLNPELR